MNSEIQLENRAPKFQSVLVMVVVVVVVVVVRLLTESGDDQVGRRIHKISSRRRGLNSNRPQAFIYIYICIAW